MMAIKIVCWSSWTGRECCGQFTYVLEFCVRILVGSSTVLVLLYSILEELVFFFLLSRQSLPIVFAVRSCFFRTQLVFCVLVQLRIILLFFRLQFYPAHGSSVLLLFQLYAILLFFLDRHKLDIKDWFWLSHVFTNLLVVSFLFSVFPIQSIDQVLFNRQAYPDVYSWHQLKFF